MNRMCALAGRNAREILRDPLTLAFGAGFPLVVLLLLSMIQRSVPVELFMPERLAPGVVVFGQSFLALFAAQLISKDRASALMMRLLTAPVTAADFMLGYAMPLIPIALAQGALCMVAAFALGLAPTWNALACIVAVLPCALFNIALGLLFGSLLTERQVGGVCGAALTNLAAWLSGAWFELSLVGGAFEAIARALPYANAVDVGRAVLAGNLGGAGGMLAITAAWALGAGALAVAVFSRRMRFS